MKKSAATLILLTIPFLCSAEVFRFKYQKGDTSRILSTVEEEAVFNGVHDHSATILNRITSEVTNVTETGSGIHKCTFMTSEESTGSTNGSRFTFGKEYKSIFERDVQGHFTISDNYFMPTVRDVPYFPEGDVSIGDTWQAEGHEAHDLRSFFNVSKPFKVPFNAEYCYLDYDEETDLHKISVRYTMTMKSPSPHSSKRAFEYPLKTTGFSDEIIWWDNNKGTIDHYTENFKIIIETSFGNVYEFFGTAKAEVTNFKRTATVENVMKVQQVVSDLGIENVTVTAGEKGLTLAMEDIKFLPDSSELIESEKRKIEQIGQIIAEWPDNDILVTGHTALAGNEKMRQILSEERAGTVADYLVKIGAKDRYHIFTQGMGATQPIASNDTEAGKARNRRVEITIMDK